MDMITPIEINMLPIKPLRPIDAPITLFRNNRSDVFRLRIPSTSVPSPTSSKYDEYWVTKFGISDGHQRAPSWLHDTFTAFFHDPYRHLRTSTTITLAITASLAASDHSCASRCTQRTGRD